jgi:hypothetical protein
MTSSRPWLVALLLSTTSCSLLVDAKADQCNSDIDCVRFPGTFCDLSVRLCKAGDSSDADTLQGPSQDGSADACATISSFENACTNATCRPFDNRARLKHLPREGGLTPLPPRDASASPDTGAPDGPTTDGAKSDLDSAVEASRDAGKDQ